MKEQLRGESKKNSRRKKTKLQKYVFDEQKVEDTEIINDDIEEDEFADGNIMGLNYRTPNLSINLDFTVTNGIKFKTLNIKSTNYHPPVNEPKNNTKNQNNK